MLVLGHVHDPFANTFSSDIAGRNSSRVDHFMIEMASKVLRLSLRKLYTYHIENKTGTGVFPFIRADQKTVLVNSDDYSFLTTS